MTDEWVRILYKVKEKIGDAIDFFRATEGWVENGTLQVRVSTKFLRGHIEKNYTAALQGAANVKQVNIQLKEACIPVMEERTVEPEPKPVPLIVASVSQRNLDYWSIMAKTAAMFDVEISDLKNPNTEMKRIARLIAIGKIYDETELYQKDIADVFNINRGTVASNIRQYEEMRKEDEGFEKKVEIDWNIYPTMKNIIRRVGIEFGISPELIKSRKRTSDAVTPRQVVMYLAEILTPNSQASIGRELNRDHSTVIYSIAKISDLVKTNKTIAEKIDRLKGTFSHDD